MSRLLLIPIAALLAAGGVAVGPGEEAPAPPAQTVVTPAADSDVRATNR
ncbi:hypothetical protein [Nocardioides sp. SYSU D00065]|nr:hypothetical protein [Nocardioides sp. SYSU D00065]